MSTSSDVSAGVVAASLGIAAPAASAPRPWGIWVSLVCYLLVFEARPRLYDDFVKISGLQPVLEHSAVLHAIELLTAWGIGLAIIVLAVKLTDVPLRDYLGWIRPRGPDIALALGVIAALYAILVVLFLKAGDPVAVVKGYRTAIAGGMSPWWYVLRWWPAIILAPLVEESFFRGFLWYGVKFRFGNGAAFLGTTLLFAAMHYNYWARDGIVDPTSVVQYLLMGSIFGGLRWRSGSTIVSMIAHGVSNASLNLSVMVVSALIP
jgi:membrane protease YdiL (CAAX protease family)